MRTNLFLSTLFAVSLVGGVALAEKPTHDRPVREPRAIQALRVHGDTVDKAYAHAGKASHAGNASSSATRETKSPLRDTAASRINCSDTGADCGRTSRPAQASHGAGAGAGHVGVQKDSTRSPLRQNADSRMNCNEADECSASSKSAASKWSGGAGAKVGKNAGANVLTPRDAQPRMLGQAGSERMACNEADECMMSSKASKKIWALESIKAGTFRSATGDVTPTKGQKTADRAAQQRDREHTAADRQSVDHQH
ncbi:MAG: hypothetical protein ABI193_11295 [Minicystis sp.]